MRTCAECDAVNQSGYTGDSLRCDSMTEAKWQAAFPDGSDNGLRCLSDLRGHRCVLVVGHAGMHESDSFLEVQL